MRALDLDNLDLASAQRAIEKAREEKPWCKRDPKDPNSYRVLSRFKYDSSGRETEPHFITFIWSTAGRFAICTCDSMIYNSDRGRICYGIARAYIQHKRNLEREGIKKVEAVAA